MQVGNSSQVAFTYFLRALKPNRSNYYCCPLSSRSATTRHVSRCGWQKVDLWRASFTLNKCTQINALNKQERLPQRTLSSHLSPRHSRCACVSAVESFLFLCVVALRSSFNILWKIIIEFCDLYSARRTDATLTASIVFAMCMEHAECAMRQFYHFYRFLRDFIVLVLVRTSFCHILRFALHPTEKINKNLHYCIMPHPFDGPISRSAKKLVVFIGAVGMPLPLNRLIVLMSFQLHRMLRDGRATDFHFNFFFCEWVLTIEVEQWSKSTENVPANHQRIFSRFPLNLFR